MSVCWPSFYTVLNCFHRHVKLAAVPEIASPLSHCFIGKQCRREFPTWKAACRADITCSQIPSIPDLRPAFQAGSHERPPIQPAAVLLLRHSSQQSHSDLSAPFSAPPNSAGYWVSLWNGWSSSQTESQAIVCRLQCCSSSDWFTVLLSEILSSLIPSYEFLFSFMGGILPSMFYRFP